MPAGHGSRRTRDVPGDGEVPQDLFDEVLGLPVRIGRLERFALGDGVGGGVAVDRRGRGEDELSAAVLVHALEQHDRPHHVVVVVQQRLGDAFAHGLETRKVNDSVKRRARVARAGGGLGVVLRLVAAAAAKTTRATRNSATCAARTTTASAIAAVIVCSRGSFSRFLLLLKDLVKRLNVAQVHAVHLRARASELGNAVDALNVAVMSKTRSILLRT